MALEKRRINFSFKLSAGTFSGGSNADVVTLPDLRAAVKIVKAGTNAMSMHARIYGMTLSLMDKLATLGLKNNLLERNSVTVSAGTTDPLGIVFVGTVMMAWIDFQSAPEVAFDVFAQAGGAEAVIPAKPSSFKGSGDVATIMGGFAAGMQLAFENNGITKRIPNPYFSGSTWEQAQACAIAAGIEVTIDNGKLAIWPKNGSRGGVVPLLSTASEMIGYPTYTAVGIVVRTIFNPSVSFGGQVQIESSLKPPTGLWNVYNLSHDLDTLVPHGQWFSTISGYNPKSPQPILAQ